MSVNAVSKKETKKPISNDNKKLIVQLEKEIMSLEKKLATVETALADPDIYQPNQKEKMRALTLQKKSLNDEIKAKEKEWERLSE